MKKLSSKQIREMWYGFFEKKGHAKIESAPLLPKDDKTLLFINAGVTPLKKYFDGSVTPESRRLCSIQKCIRTNDIENVGNTARHHTFFEMLGNFSIGDYFKKEAISFAYELLFSEEYFNIDRKKIYITYYPSDTECRELWLQLGIDKDRLIPNEGNFWEIGNGPCGPCTEIFFDRGAEYDKRGKELIEKDLENDRFVEIWNIVFSQFDLKEGVKRENYKELPSKNIDTGAGLERFACISQNVKTNFETDLFFPIIKAVEKLSNVKYTGQKEHKVIADHIRTIFMALYDGAVFSNLGRGYVLRRLLRRAMKMGHFLGLDEPFLAKLIIPVYEIFKDSYNLEKERLNVISEMIIEEEKRFTENLRLGEKKIKEIMEKAKSKKITGSDAFLLFDTFGFPIDLTKEYAEESGFKVDIKGFDKKLEEAQEKSRESQKEAQSMTSQNDAYLKYNDKSEFIYDACELTSTVIKVFKDGIVLDKTPFYAESGGQVSDLGTMNGVEVKNVIKLPNGQHLHILDSSNFKEGDKVVSKVLKESRDSTAKNHTATHLTHKALKEVLGTHVSQQGSKVDSNFLRFDFNHFKEISNDEILKIESIVKDKIKKGLKVETNIMPIEKAKSIGAEMLFGEKYGKVVRVVSVKDFSDEFCGGTHVKNTKDIKDFAIVQLQSIGSGTYRVLAVTGDVTKHLQENLKETIDELNKIKETHPELKFELPKFTNSYFDILNYRTMLQTIKLQLVELQKKNLKKETKNLKEKALKLLTGDKDEILVLNGEDNNAIKDLIDELVNEKNLDNLVIINLSNDKASFFVKSSTDKARDIINDLNSALNGRGGGNNSFSQGSSTNTSVDAKVLKKAIFK